MVLNKQFFVFSALLGGLGVCLGWAVAAQTPVPQQKPPVFRAGAVFVSVDAYPRRDGKIVEGLTKDDFEILEDGKAQSVENFEFIRIESFTPDAARRDPNTAEEGNRQAADPRNRVFVIYLDIFHTGVFGAHYSRQPVLTFLRRTIGPNDLFGVMTPELPATALTFGRRIETIETELEKYWDWGESGRAPMARSNYEGQLLACDPKGGLLARYREDASAQNLEDMVERLGNLRDERKNILFISGGWVPRPAPPLGTSSSRRPSIPTIGVGPTGRIGMGPNSNSSHASDAAFCNAQAARLTGLDYERRFTNLLEMARRANVAFYPVDVAGLRAPVGGAPVDVGPVETLRALADNTDGHAIVNTNDIVSGVRRIADDLSAFYLLGYYSSNSAADGRFRHIQVKVKQPGVKVSARRGYAGPTAAIRKAELEAASKPEYVPTSVDREMARLSRLRTDARVFSSAVRTPTGIDVVVEISSLEFSSGRWSSGAGVKLDILSKDEGAKPVAAGGRLDSGSRGVLIKVALAATSASGWRVRARVEGGGESLDDEIEIAPSSASVIGEPTVFRANPGPRAPLRPVADFKFFRTERVHVEWIVTKPLDNRVARLLTRKNEPLAVPVALTERMDGDRIVLAADLVLAPLADGDYAIEVTGSAGGEKFQRLLAFRVVR